MNDTLGYIDCNVIEIVPGGDHDIFIGQCVAGESREGEPLVFYCGKFTKLPATALAQPSTPGRYLLEDTFEYYGAI